MLQEASRRYTADEALTLRADLAAAHRVAALEGLSEGTWNHFSAKLPGSPLRLLMTPGDWPFAAVTASSLLEVDSNGSNTEDLPNSSAWIIHGPIHSARPDAQCVLHGHPPHVTALTMAAGRHLDERASQMAADFFEDVAYYDEYDGALEEEAEGRRMAEVLGSKRVLLMRNHGVLIAAPTISNAIYSLYCIERAAQMQLLAEGDGRVLAQIPVEVASSTRRSSQSYEAYLPGMRRLLDARDPSYRS